MASIDFYSMIYAPAWLVAQGTLATRLTALLVALLAALLAAMLVPLLAIGALAFAGGESVLDIAFETDIGTGQFLWEIMLGQVPAVHTLQNKAVFGLPQKGKAMP